jgi:UDP-glucose 4-epimerase
MGMLSPIMDAARALEELGWKPRFSAEETLRELLDGLREGAGIQTPPLDPAASGPLRAREFATGVGATDKLR